MQSLSHGRNYGPPPLWAALLGFALGCAQGRAQSSELVAPSALEAGVSVDASDSRGISAVARAFFTTEQDHGFLGEPEQTILDKLSHGAVIAVKPGRGGRSVAFRITLEDGTRAYFKPEQTFSAAHWYAEVVAYYLDRALGLGKVAPVVSRRLPWNKLIDVANGQSRVNELIIQEDQTIRGALIWWLPETLTPLRTDPGWEHWIRIDPWPKWTLSPFQQPVTYTRSLNAIRASSNKGAPVAYTQIPTFDRPERASELSDIIVFDYLALNLDRWSRLNYNLLTYGSGGPLIYLDNGAGFSSGVSRVDLMETRLRAVQRFRRSTIEALRKFDPERFRQLLRRDKLGPLLTKGQFKGLELRRRVVLERVAALQAKFGETVYTWP
jgi:hypothetical protein